MTNEYKQAHEVAENILENGFLYFDPQAWVTNSDSYAAECFYELVAHCAEFKFDNNINTLENGKELLTDILDKMRSTLEFMAQKEINASKHNGLLEG
jgi:hypothetical protein